jgi:hypothetical protein
MECRSEEPRVCKEPRSPAASMNAMARRSSLVLAVATILVVGACQSPQSKTAIELPASRSQPMNCAPIWPPSATIAKYPPNAEPGFKSPEEVTAFLEKRWPLANVRKFAIPERRHNDAWQNLVADTQEIWAGRLYCDKTTDFDSIEWYATTENGRVQEYSLNTMRGKDFWLLEIGSPASVRKPPVVEPNFRAPQFVGHK